MRKLSNILVIVFLGGCGIYTIFGATRAFYRYESKAKAFEIRQQQRDSIIAAKDVEILKLKAERLKLNAVKDSLEVQLFESFVEINKLLKPQVTTATRNEALLWIEEHNRTLRH